MRLGLRLVGALAVTVALVGVTEVGAAVNSFLSTVGTVGGGVAPGNPELTLDVGQNGSLYLWLQNTATLRSVAYDLAAATPDVIQFTGVEVFTPDLLVGGVTDIGDRWNLPVAVGEISPDGNSITNFSAVNVDKAGLDPNTRAFDALFDVVGTSALFAKIDFMAVGGGSTGLNLSEGSTKIVEAGNSGSPELSFGSALINVMGGPDPVVDDLALFNDVLGGSVNGVVTGTDVETWEETLEFVSYTPGYGAGPAADGSLPALAASWNAQTQTFDWDTTGSYPGDYLWRVTGSNGGASDTGDISVAHRIPEPATLALFGLAMVGFAGFRRK